MRLQDGHILLHRGNGRRQRVHDKLEKILAACTHEIKITSSKAPALFGGRYFYAQKRKENNMEHVHEMIAEIMDAITDLQAELFPLIDEEELDGEILDYLDDAYDSLCDIAESI